MAQLAKYSFYEDEQDSFNLELELQKLRPTKKWTTGTDQEPSFYYLSGSKNYVNLYTSNNNIDFGNMGSSRSSDNEKDKQRQVRNQMILAKIQELENRFTSVTFDRQKKLETMKREYEALVRKYRPSQYNRNLAAGRHVDPTTTAPAPLISTGVNTILTGPVKPIELYQIGSSLDENQKSRININTNGESNWKELSSNGISIGNLRSTTNLFPLHDCPPPLVVFNEFPAATLAENNVYEAIFQRQDKRKDDIGRSSNEYNGNKLMNKYNKSNDNEQENRSKRKSSILNLSTSNSDDVFPLPLQINNIANTKPTKSGPSRSRLWTDDDETSETVSFALAKNRQLQRTELATGASALSVNLSSESTFTTTPTTTSYKLQHQARSRTGESGKEKANLLGFNQDNLGPAYGNASKSSLAILDGPGSATMNEILLQNDEQEVDRIELSEVADDDVVDADEDNTQTSLAGESLMMDSIQNKTPDSLPRDESELVNIIEAEEDEEVTKDDYDDENEHEREVLEKVKRKLINDNGSHTHSNSKADLSWPLIQEDGVQEPSWLRQEKEVHDMVKEEHEAGANEMRLRNDISFKEIMLSKSDNAKMKGREAEMEADVGSAGTLFSTTNLASIENEQAISTAKNSQVSDKDKDEKESQDEKLYEMKLDNSSRKNSVTSELEISEQNNTKKSNAAPEKPVPEQPNKRVFIKLDYEDSEGSEFSDKPAIKKEIVVGGGVGSGNITDLDTLTNNNRPIDTGAADSNLITESDLAKMVESDFDDFFDM